MNRLLVIATVMLLASLMLLWGQVVRTGVTLHIGTNNLSTNICQPISGIWYPLTRRLEPYGFGYQSGFLNTYCGETVEVYWLSQTSSLYECQATDDMKTWQGSLMQIAGTGGLVTQYDVPREHRHYRVKETP